MRHTEHPRHLAVSCLLKKTRFKQKNIHICHRFYTLQTDEINIQVLLLDQLHKLPRYGTSPPPLVLDNGQETTAL